MKCEDHCPQEMKPAGKNSLKAARCGRDLVSSWHYRLTAGIESSIVNGMWSWFGNVATVFIMLWYGLCVIK